MPKVPILSAYRNEAYGPPLVTQKYAPLQNFTWTGTDEKFCARIVSNRMRLLTGAGLLPQPLTLVVPDWAAAIAAEAGKKPPLVVISTNRSKWIKKAFDAVAGQAFENPGDLEALQDYGNLKISPPIYCPVRFGDPDERNVYIVVNTAEYDEYKTRLADLDVTIVGWSFRKPSTSELRLCGFGASRFAAIQFCKTLREQAGEPWNYAWLLDDNVVGCKKFPGFIKIEDKMAEADPRIICSGFSGGTQAESHLTNVTWARKEKAAGRGKQTEELDPPKAKGLIQQAALWNISYLADDWINFAPMFVESGEDVSLGHYFNRRKLPYYFYDGITVVKEASTADNTSGSQIVADSRANLTEWLALQEASDPIPPPAADVRPPPIRFMPQLSKKDQEEKEDSRIPVVEQTVSRFVVDYVLPRAIEPTRSKARDRATRNTAMCQAVEETICKAMEAGNIHDAPTDNALDKIFKLNGARAQTVVRISKP